VRLPAVAGLSGSAPHWTRSITSPTDRDDTSAVREKVSAKIRTLDSQLLETSMTALLSLLGVPVEDAAWEQLDPAQRRQQTLDGVKDF
jgi:hypothetical protein